MTDIHDIIAKARDEAAGIPTAAQAEARAFLAEIEAEEAKLETSAHGLHFTMADWIIFAAIVAATAALAAYML